MTEEKRSTITFEDLPTMADKPVKKVVKKRLNKAYLISYSTFNKNGSVVILCPDRPTYEDVQEAARFNGKIKIHACTKFKNKEQAIKLTGITEVYAPIRTRI